MSRIAGKHIVLFMTRGVALDDWRRIGMLNRELALYRRLVEAGMRVSFVTGGGSDDVALAEEIAPIEVCCNRWNLPGWLYAAALPWLHRKTLRDCDVIKTNQTDGGLAALRAARWWGKPLIARCGYMRSLNHARRYGIDERRTRSARLLERRLFKAAKLVQVTTIEMKSEIGDRLGSAIGQRVRVVPNYVDVIFFRPCHETERPSSTDLIFIGRFDREKNLPALLEAVRDLPIRLVMIGGGGAGRAGLEPVVEGGCVQVEWWGQVPHDRLPGALCGAKIFVLPSHYEGHPKALIEAMACGLPVIVSDRPGLRELVRHGQTGYVCGVEAIQIRAAVEAVLGDRRLRERLGTAARVFAEKHFSLNRVFELEVAVLEEAMADE